MDAQQLLLAALKQRSGGYLAEHDRCRDAFSEEAIHDLRVAARRLLAYIELLRTLSPHQHLQKIRRALKNQLDSLDELRDTQVMLMEIAQTLEALPELAPFQKYLQKREKRLLKAAGRDIDKSNSRAVRRKLDKVFSRLAKPMMVQDLRANLLAVVDDAYLTVYRRQELINPASPITIHSVRVAFKKFRYMIEIINPVLENFPETLFKAMHDYQSSMGGIQDTEVFLRTLQAYAGQHQACNMQAVLSFYEQRHTRLIAAYLENMNEISHFWRKTPEKPFPWEQE